jgi:hypothetical protein
MVHATRLETPLQEPPRNTTTRTGAARVCLEPEHAALQQRAAGEAPLHEAARVCLLMRVGVEQANTPS